MEVTKKHIPSIGILSALSIISIAASIVYLDTFGKAILAFASLVVAVAVADKVKYKPPCYKWEQVLYVIAISLLLLVFVAAAVGGDRHAR